MVYSARIVTGVECWSYSSDFIRWNRFPHGDHVEKSEWEDLYHISVYLDGGFISAHTSTLESALRLLAGMVALKRSL